MKEPDILNYTVKSLETWGYDALARRLQHVIDFETSDRRKAARHYMGMVRELDREKSL